MSLGWPARTSRPLLITGKVSLLLVLILLDTGLLLLSSEDGDFRGLGEAEEIPGDTLTTEAALGDGAVVFLPMLSGSYGLKLNCFDDVTTVGGDCDEVDDEDEEVRPPSDTTRAGLFLLLILLLLLDLLLSPLLLLRLLFSCKSLFPPTSAPIWEQV